MNDNSLLNAATNSAVLETSSDAQNAFDEERKILLLGVAEILTSVVKLMAKANANLKGLQESTIEVETVANMWKSAYRRRGQDEEHEDDNFHQSSLSLQHNNHTMTMD